MYTAQRRKRIEEPEKAATPLLRTGEACRILCIHQNTLRRWSKQGLIRAYRVGPRGDRRFRRDDIIALLIEKTKGGRTHSSN